MNVFTTVCPGCYESDFRLSHFRRTDLNRLLLLQYPIRCRKCAQRTHGNLLLACNLYMLHRHPHPHHHPTA